MANETGYPPMTSPWEFPSPTVWSIPLIITCLLWLVLLCEHLVYQSEDAEGWEVRFQALYVRIVFVFPLFAALAYAGMCFPWMFHWFELIGVYLEIYVLLGFYAFLTGLGYLKSVPAGSFPDCLLIDESKWTNRPVRCCGGRFGSGQRALNFFFWSIAQFGVVKPIILIIIAVTVYETGHEPSKVVKVVLNIISAVSIFVATLSVLRVYKGLKVQPNSVMQGHSGLLKIGVVKLLFIFIVLNNLILKNLAADEKLPVPETLCTSSILATSEKYREYCELRTINAIFSVQIIICVIPAVLSYRHHGLQLKRRFQWGKVPRFLALVLLRPFDLGAFWNNRLAPSKVDNVVVMMSSSNNKGLNA